MTAATRTNSTFMLSLKHLFLSSEIVIALVLMVIIGMMVVPLPSFAIDLFIVLNIGVSFGIILLSLFIEQPSKFSAFPTLLLVITLFRLGLNISTSRAILLTGDAGQVIFTFGSMVVGGNYVIGVVVFIMLMIIQFMVINNGSARVAEVAARFTLDAMPGKQMSIDADLNAGIIDDKEAIRRRKDIQTSADFYGTMDGGIKFVRGDTTASIIIMLVDIAGGILTGILMRQMDAMTALQTYTLITVGAGLAIQIPALLVSAAAGLIVTRTSSDEPFGKMVFNQLSNFNSVAIGSVIMLSLALIPGWPKIPFIIVGGLLGGGAYWLWRSSQKPAMLAEGGLPAIAPPATREPESPQAMLEMLVVDPLELEVGYGLIPLIDEERPDNLLRRITGIRRQIMQELGLVLPVVRVRDNLRLPPQAYRIKIRGEEVGKGELMLDRLLAIPSGETEAKIQGIPTTEPAFGLPALWIAESEKGRAELSGYTVVNPLSVLSTHVTELIRSYSPDLLSRQMVKEMIQEVEERSPATLEGLIPELLSLSDVQAVLRNLLEEKVSIRDMVGILEVLANNARVTRDPNILAEAIRQAMARNLSNQYKDEENYLHVFTLAPQLEGQLRDSLVHREGTLGFQIDASLAQAILTRIGEQMEKLAELGFIPIILVPRELRLAIWKLVHQALPNLAVMAFSEVSTGTRVQAHGMVDVA
ncbi:MAG: flagellar biosynthesis protein FlhA [Chloroflexota bacterium]